MIWEKKWSYSEGFLIAFSLFAIGLALEQANGTVGLPKIGYPMNIYFGVGFVSILMLNYFIFGNSKLVVFLKSVPAAIASIGFFAWNALLMGLFLQDTKVDDWRQILALSQVTDSWYYLLANLFLLCALGTLIIDKIYHFRWKDLGVMVSHLGLWLAIFAASLGSFELQRLEMNLTEGQLTNVATDRYQRDMQCEMPFALKLNDFVLEEYPPKMGIVDNKSGDLLHEQGKNIRLLEDQTDFEILGWRIFVKEQIYKAAKAGDTYYFNNEMGSPPAVLLSAVSANGDTVDGWISCGSFNKPFESLKLNADYSLVMLLPEPKNYLSIIEIYQPSGFDTLINLEVNKPYLLDDWKLYQLSFNDDFGKWSDTSVVELVRDPWLPMVYWGIFMMLAGALYLFWQGIQTRRNVDKLDGKKAGKMIDMDLN